MKLKLSPNWLLVFVPVSVFLEHAEAAPPLIFFTAALAIIPIAGLLVRATEQIAVRTGDAVGGLLNATFGNAPELIITIVALRAGLFDMVRASLVGAILANLLFGVGLAFFLCGLRSHAAEYNPASTRLYGSMMLIAAFTLSVPSAFSRITTTDETLLQERHINLLLSLLLLGAYVLYLVFMLKTHPDFFKSEGGGDPHHEGKLWGVPRAVVSLVVASVLAAWMSEILVGAAEGTGKSLGMSEVFIGIIFLAIVGGIAEIGSAIAMARKNKMDLALGIAMGSCIQIALFVAPLLVLVSYIVSPQPFTLAFRPAELYGLFIAVLIGSFVAGDGRSNWYKGVQLLLVYAIMAVVFYFLPVVPQ